MSFEVNNNQYTRGYYLADGIYPTWPVLIKTINRPQDDASTYFAKLQEAARKDIARAFGILQAQWHIISRPCRLWALHDIRRVMYACILLHNMIVEDREIPDPKFDEFHTNSEVIPNHRNPQLRQSPASLISNYLDLRNAEVHHCLMNDLKIHNSMARGSQNMQ